MSKRLIHYSLPLEGLSPDIASILPLVPGTQLIDRTGTLKMGRDFKFLDALPTYTTNKSFAQICDERARELAALNHPIDLYWSGGIDSTVALVALINAGASERITVCLNRDSIVEYPLFHAKHISGKLTERLVPPTVKLAWRPEPLTVTGELGDQIFGSVLLSRFREWKPPINTADYESKKHNLFRAFDEPWEKWVGALLRSRGGDEGTAIANLTRLTAKAPFPIKNFFDATWWLNITCKWQDATLRFFKDIDVTEEQFSRCHHFFRTDDFQAWSMTEENHRHNKIIVSGQHPIYKTYKFTAKDYIYAFTRDQDYRDNKIKVGSLPADANNVYKEMFENFTREGNGRN